MEHIYIDSELCTTCGGKCCKKSGCGFLPKDFSNLSYNGLLKKLEEGNISITALINFCEINSKTYWFPILALQIRNKDRGIVDLVSYKSGCSILTDEGCPLEPENRPSLALSLIPKGNYYDCVQTINNDSQIKAWLKYQDTLFKLVAYYTHKSVKEQIELDMENVKKILLNSKTSNFIFDKEMSELNFTYNMFAKAEYSSRALGRHDISYKMSKNKKKK